MTGFILPLTLLVSTSARTDRVRIALRVPGPVPWSEVADAVRAAGGLQAATRLFLGVGEVEPRWVVGAPPLLAGVTISTRPAPDVPVTATFALAVVAGPDAGRSVPLGFEPVTVGRASGNDLVVDDPTVSARHATVTPSAAGLAVTDHGSTNGVRVDGQSPEPGALHAIAPMGAMIRLGDSLLRASLTAEPAAPVTPDGRGHLVVHRSVAASRPGPSDPPRPDHPAPPDRRPVPVLAGLVAGALGVGLAVALGSWMYLAIAAAGPVTVLVSAAVDRAGGRRRRRRAAAEQARVDAAWIAEVQAAQVARREAAWEGCPDPATLLLRAHGVRAGLWSRDPADPGFWRLAVGVDAGRRRETPVVVDLGLVGVLGLVGPSGPLLRWLILQAACLLAPGDVGLALRGDTAAVRSALDLPHVVSAGHPDAGSMAGLLVVVDDMRRPAGDPATVELVNAALRGPRTGERRIAVIWTARHRDELPVGCRAVIESGCGRAQFDVTPEESRTSDGPAGPGHLVPTGVSDSLFTDAMSALSALVDEPRDGRLPDLVNWGDLVGRPDRDALRRGWRCPAVAAAIGVGARGVVTLDLDRDGPHLLIAGTTGSGKSELLRTLVAGLAVAAPPDRMTFLLIDYKGGAAFAPLTGLPHVAGLITDLDGPLAGRALGSLRAELRRREQQLAGAADPPPRLVIVVDEFAALAADQPAFLTGLVDVAQRGRALGLHLVLATQRPTGVVSPAIRANTSARICLRVTDPADSQDIVGSGRAADIPASQPGRAVLWTSSTGAMPFQTARITDPDDERIIAWRQPGPADLHGTSRRSVGDHHGDLERLVAAAADASAGLPRVAAPWLPPLPAQVESSEVGSACVALLDDPDRQRRQELAITAGSILVFGRRGSGRTTALARIAAAAAADGCRLAIVDPRGTLRSGWEWPAADTALDGADPALVSRLTQLLGIPGPDRDPILLVIDGWEEVTAATDAADQGATSLALVRMFDTAPAGVRIAASGGVALRHHPVATRAAHLIDLDAGPDAGPGRGRYRDHLVQVVIPPDRPSGSRLARGRPVVVRPLPTLVRRAGLPPARSTAVPIGVGGDAADPVTIDLTGPGGAWVVAGRRRSGVTTALHIVAEGAAAAGITVWWLAPLGAEGEPVPIGQRILPGAAELQDALARHSGPLLLVADLDAHSAVPPSGLATPNAEHELRAELLTRFCSVCGPGQFLLIGSRSDALAAAYRGPLAEALTFRRAVLLDPEPADGLRLGVRLPRRTAGTPPGRGYLLVDGDMRPIQLTEPGG